MSKHETNKEPNEFAPKCHEVYLDGTTFEVNIQEAF